MPLLKAMRTSQKKAFDARIPKTTGSKPREGLDRETADRLMAILNPEHADNPWRNDKGLAQRNQAMIQLLYTQGIRRGELLGIKIGDIDPSALTLTIHRRPDDPDDRRHAQPKHEDAGPSSAIAVRRVRYAHELHRGSSAPNPKRP